MKRVIISTQMSEEAAKMLRIVIEGDFFIQVFCISMRRDVVKRKEFPCSLVELGIMFHPQGKNIIHSSTSHFVSQRIFPIKRRSSTKNGMSETYFDIPVNKINVIDVPISPYRLTHQLK